MNKDEKLKLEVQKIRELEIEIEMERYLDFINGLTMTTLSILLTIRIVTYPASLFSFFKKSFTLCSINRPRFDWGNPKTNQSNQLDQSHPGLFLALLLRTVR